MVPHVPDLKQTAITNVRLVLDHAVREGCVVLAGDTIAGVHAGCCELPHDAEIVDGGGRLLAPGLIDIHVHGGGGFNLMSDDPEQVRGYARWVASRGVTGFLVSTSGSDHADIVRRLRAVAPAIGTHRRWSARAGLSPRRAVHQPGAEGRVPADAGCARRTRTSIASCSRHPAGTCGR